MARDGAIEMNKELRMLLVVTDLDGTLLDHDTYTFAPAQPALDRLRALEVPVIFASSKTRAEIEYWRQQMDNPHAFISENGGAIFFPRDIFPEAPAGAVARGSYWVIELGERYEVLTHALAAASQQSGCAIRGFHEMTVEEVAELCAMPVELATLARQREYDEPFLILEAGCEPALLAAIAAQQLRHTKGGRFHHILGESDKARAMRLLQQAYTARYGSIRTIALGDNFNDLEMLQAADEAVIIGSSHAAELAAAAPGAMVTEERGPAGWNEALQKLLGRE